MNETMTTQVSSPSAQAASTPLLTSDLDDLAVATNSSELEQVAGELVSQSVQDAVSFKPAPSTPMPLPVAHTPHTPLVQTDQSPSSHCLLASSVDTGLGYISKSSPLLSASGSPTPPTPQSHCSASSPLSQQALSDVASSVAIPPPPYPSSISAAEHTMLPPSSTSQSPSPIEQLKPGLPPPPKKPLTPYMRFSKSIWQKVKAANQNSSVCEIGATIGRMWREMNEIDKQHYNEDFMHDKARYDGELQTYLKATGLQASDLAKPKGKKARPVAPLTTSAQPRPPPTMTAEGTAVNYVDGLSTPEAGGSASGFQPMGSNGIVTGGLPHFCQVWSGSAGSDAYGAEKLLAQMDADGQASLFANPSVTDPDAVLPLPEDVSQQVASLYSEQNQLLNSAATASAGQPQQQPSQDSAMTNWLWQQYAISNGDQYGATASADTLHQNGADHSSAAAASGNMIIYQLSADGTQTAFTQPMPPANTAPAMPDILEPGEVRLPPNGSAAPVADQQLYSGLTPHGYQLPGNNNGQWTSHNGNNTTAATVVGGADAEKQLLRGALVDKVREIQRLTRELEQAYALIHQLKQHNEFLQRQWGQAVIPAAADGTAART